DEDARAPAFAFGERRDAIEHALQVWFGGAELRTVHAGDRLDVGLMPAEDLLEHARDLAHGGLGPRRVDAAREQVAVSGRGAAPQGGQRPLHLARVAFGPEPPELLDLRRPDLRLIDLEHVHALLLREPILVHADDGLETRVDPRLGARAGLFDAQLGDPGLDRLGHAAQALDLLEVRPGPLREVVRQPLDVVAAAPRVDEA